MSVTFIIFLAIVLGIFGLWGFLRGWKAALVMLVLILGSLLLLSAAPESVAALFDYVNKAAALVTGSTKPLINTAPSSLVVFMLIGAVILGFLLGLLRIFRAKPSFMGFLLGFISGYFFTAYMLAALMPQRAILPLPIKIPGLTSISLSAAAASPPSTVCLHRRELDRADLPDAMPADRDRGRHLPVHLADHPHRESGQPEGVNQMTPVGVVFLVVMLLFGVIGIVRGVAKELGATTMLLVALMLLQLTVTMFASQIASFLTQVFGVSPADVPTIVAVCSALFLLVIDIYLVPGGHPGFSHQEHELVSGPGYRADQRLSVCRKHVVLFAKSWLAPAALAGQARVQPTQRDSDQTDAAGDL